MMADTIPGMQYGRLEDPDFRTDIGPMLGRHATTALTLLYLALLLGACVYSIVWGG